MKLARRRINRGSRFRKRGKGLKFGARPEKTGAIAHESGAGILAAGAATLKVGAAIGRSGADDFSFGAMAFENGAAIYGVRAVIVKTGATTEKELAYGKKLSSAVARLRGCSGVTPCSEFPHGLRPSLKTAGSSMSNYNWNYFMSEEFVSLGSSVPVPCLKVMVRQETWYFTSPPIARIV